MQSIILKPFKDWIWVCAKFSLDGNPIFTAFLGTKKNAIMIII